MTSLTLLLALCGLSSLLSAYAANKTFVSEERQLYHHLLENYEKSVRPVQHHGDNVSVKLSLMLINIESLDEETQVLYSTAELRMQWKDFQLQWEPADFGGVYDIRIPIDELWVPDIMIHNSIEPESTLPSHHLAVVSSDGSVFWLPAVSLATHCPTNVQYFPFDQQRCDIKFGSWTYSQNMVDLDLADGNNSLQDCPFGQWDLVETTVNRNIKKYVCCPETYVDLVFGIVLRRSSAGHNMFLAPSVALSLVVPAVFIMPAGSTEKITLGVGVLLAHILMLGELIDVVPSGHRLHTPLIAHFFVANIVVVALSLVISTVIVNFWSRGVSRRKGPPAILKLVFLNKVVTTMLCFNWSRSDIDRSVALVSTVHCNPDASMEAVSSELNVSSDDRVQIMQNKSSQHLAATEWYQLADIIDRLFLIVFILIASILCLGFLVYLHV